MFHFSIQNEAGSKLTFNNESIYQLFDIQGLDSPEATINTDKTTQTNGTSYLSYSIGDREINFSIKVHGNIEANRLNLYNYIRAGAKLRLFFSNTARNIYIDGFISHIDYNLFATNQIIQVTVLCPYPYFANYEETNLSLQSSTPLFKFPFSIPASGIPFSTYSSGSGSVNNIGERETGAVFMLRYTGNDTYSQVLSIKNETTGKMLQFSGISLDSNHYLLIDTHATKLMARLYDSTGTDFDNVIAKMTSISEFITFPVGQNTIKIGYSPSAGSRTIYTNSYLSLTVAFNAEWEAV